MFEHLKRSARIGASYAGSLGEMVRLEARQELQQFVGRMAQRAIAIGLLLFGVMWLNIGAFVLIWDSPYRHWMPFVIAVGLLVVAILVWMTARVEARQPHFARARRALERDAHLWGIDLSAAQVLRDIDSASAKGSQDGAKSEDARSDGAEAEEFGSPDADAGRTARMAADTMSVGVTDGSGVRASVTAPPLSTEGPHAGSADAQLSPAQESARIEALDAELDVLRLALHQSVTGPWRTPAVRGASTGPGGVRLDEQGRPREFQPRSRTMRTLMSIVDGHGVTQQWPVRLAAGLAVTALARGRFRWLFRALPTLRMIWTLWARAQGQGSRPAGRRGPGVRASSTYVPGAPPRSRPPL